MVARRTPVRLLPAPAWRMLGPAVTGSSPGVAPAWRQHGPAPASGCECTFPAAHHLTPPPSIFADDSFRSKFLWGRRPMLAACAARLRHNEGMVRASRWSGAGRRNPAKWARQQLHARLAACVQGLGGCCTGWKSIPPAWEVDPTAQVWVDLGGGTGHNVELMSESSWRMNANACVACCDCCACLVACP